MRHLINRIPLFSGASGQVFRGMAMLSSGMIAGRIIGLVAIPILTRIYDPSDFGAMAVYTALVTLLAPFMALRFPVAIPLPKSDQLAVSLVALSIVLTFVTGMIVTIVLWLAAPRLLPTISMEALIPYWWIVALGAVGSAFYDIFTNWATRRKNYKLVARTSVMQSFSGSAVKVALGFIWAGPLGLLLGQILSLGGGSGSILLHYRKEFARLGHRLRMFKAAVLYQSFALYRLPAQALLAAATQAPVLLIAWQYDANLVGQFGLATTLIAVPTALLINGLSKAFYAEVAALGLRRIDQVREITFHTMKRLALIGLPVAGFLFFFGQEVSMIAFGDRWSQAGRFAEILAIYLFAGFVSAPVMRLLDLLREQWLLLLINALRLVIVLVVFALLPQRGLDLFDTVLVYALAMFAHQGISGWLVLHRLKARAGPRTA